MAATITASMAGELARKISNPTQTTAVTIGEKLKPLNEKIESLKKIFDVKSKAYQEARDDTVKQWKEEVGFDEFPIKDQKQIIEEINQTTNSSYDVLMSLQSTLNNQSSLFYKNIGLQIQNKNAIFSKSVIQDMSETIKSKFNNISSITPPTNMLDRIKSYFTSTISESYKNLSLFMKPKFDSIAGKQNESLNKQNMISSLVGKVSKEQFSQLKKSILDVRLMTADQMEVLKEKLDPVSFSLALKEYEKNKKLEDFPFSSILISMKSKLESYVKRLNDISNKIKMFASPLKLIESMFTMISEVFTTVFRVIVPTLVSMASAFFFTVLPVVLLIIAGVVLLIIVLYLLWKHFGKQLTAIWDYVKEYVVEYLIMLWKNAKEVLYWVWDTLQFAWGVITDIYDFIECIFNGDFTGAGKIVIRLMDRIVDYMSKTFGHILNIFKNLGDFLSKLPIIGPVFRFLFDIFIPFMQFFMDAFKWVYSFIKDFISVTWNNLVDSISLIKAIFSGDFAGAGVIIKGMFDRVKDFIMKKVISLLIILQQLGNSLLIPIKWLGGVFKTAWDYYSEKMGIVFDWLLGIFKTQWDFVKPIFDWIWGGLKDIIDWLGGSFKNGWDFVKPIFDWIWDSLKSFIGWLGDVFKDVWGIVKDVWGFLSNPVKLVTEITSKVGEVVSKAVSNVAGGIKDWATDTISKINPANWLSGLAVGGVVVEPTVVAFAEKVPEAAIPLNDEGLAFLRKAFNLDDKSFSATINNSDMYKYILDINDRTAEILDQTHIITAEVCKIQTPSYTENIIQSYKKFENINVGEKKEVEQKNDDTVIKMFEELKKLILKNDTTSPHTNSSDSQMDFMKLLSTGVLNRK